MPVPPQASRKYKVPSRTLYDKIKKMGITTVPRRLPVKKPNVPSTELDPVPTSTHADTHHHMFPLLHHHALHQQQPDAHGDAREPPPRGSPTPRLSDDENSSTPVVVEDEEESSSPTPTTTPAVGSFSLMGRQLYENLLNSQSSHHAENGGGGGGGDGDASSKPLDLTDTDNLLSKRPEIVEERA